MNDVKLEILNQPRMSINHAADFLSVSVQAVHKQLKMKGLTCPKSRNKLYITYEIAKQLFNIPFKRKIIVGQIVKGGTGKTTTIENIASCANTYGAKILKIDSDPQGNLTDANGIDAEDLPVLIDVIKGEARIKDSIVNITPGVDIIPSRIENVILDNYISLEKLPLHTLFSNLLAPVAENYDYIFIDCPPTMAHSVTAASLYADIVLAPLNPDKFSAKGLKILKQELERLNKNFSKSISYRVFLNKYSGKTILSDKAIVSLLSDPELEGKVLTTTVQYTQEIPNTTDSNKSLFCSMGSSTAREDFDRLTRELLEILPEPINKQRERNSTETLALATA